MTQATTEAIYKRHAGIWARNERVLLCDFTARPFVLEELSFGDPEHVCAFRTAPCDLLFIDNTTAAHDGDAVEDDLASPRLMLRLWPNRRAAFQTTT